jgi:hypothetical protein
MASFAVKNAKMVQRYGSRLNGISVTSQELTRLALKHQYACERDAYHAKRRELIALMDSQFTFAERGGVANRIAPGKALGWNDLHRRKGGAVHLSDFSPYR